MARKKEDQQVVFVEGGIVQSVLVVDPSQKKGYRETSYEVVDYDIFEYDNSPEEIRETWEGFSAELQEYFKNHLKDEYQKFQERMSEK